MGEAPTSVTIVTYLAVLSEVRLRYEYLCKIQVEDLSGITEIFGYLLKAASCYNRFIYPLPFASNTASAPKSVPLLFYLCFTLAAGL